MPLGMCVRVIDQSSMYDGSYKSWDELVRIIERESCFGYSDVKDAIALEDIRVSCSSSTGTLVCF
jgi:hypothetical protein